MSPINEAPHLLALFGQLDATGRMRLVQRIQAEALRRLKGHTPTGFNAADADHYVITAMSVARSDAPERAKAAARLLRACAHATEAQGEFDAAVLVSVYAQLDAHAVARDKAAQAKRSEGGKSKPAKLPPADDLRAEVAQLQAARGLSEADAKGIVRKRYGVTPQALNRKLKKDLNPT